MKQLLLILFLGVAFCDAGFTQAVIQGSVHEEQTGDPIPGVNVYLAGTTFGASTDAGGRYKITSPAIGSYNLVFSFVGYKKEIRQIELRPSSSFNINVRMKEKIRQLNEIEVKASNKKWKKQYDIFFDQFIGKTEYAEKVTVENPWVLDFSEHGEILTATSQQPITIINKALGYKMHVELVQFKWPKYRDRGGAYVIYPRYEPLSPESKEQAYHWKKNRVQNYAGSFIHFLKSLYKDNLDEHNFSLEQGWNLSPLPRGKTKFELMSHSNVSYDFRQNAKGFELKGKVDVRFNGTVEYQYYGSTHSLSIEKDGGINPNTENRYFFVDEYGSLLNPTSLQVYRSWADNRVANSLPTNYSIGD